MTFFSLQLEVSPERKLTFKTPATLLKWCDKELENWQPLNGVQLPFHGSLFSEISSPIDRIKNALNNYTSSPDQPNFEQELRNCASQLSQMISQSRYICSQSPLGIHIREAANRDQELCAATYFLAIQPSATSVNFTRLTGTASSYLAMFYLGVSPDTAQAAVKTLEQSSLSIKEKASNIENLEHQVEERLKAVEMKTEIRLNRLFGLVRSQLKSKRAHYFEKRDETVKDLLEFVQKQTNLSKEKITEFEEFTKDKISLQGPIHYWESKMRIHRTAAITSGCIFLVYCGIIFYYGRNLVLDTYGGVVQFLDSWHDASVASVGLFGAIVALFLVFARVIYRIFSSQLHLWNDSAERITMTETYLSLAERGHAREELLGALFSRLFSPASDGIVRDDLGAVSPLDALSKSFSGKS